MRNRVLTDERVISAVGSLGQVADVPRIAARLGCSQGYVANLLRRLEREGLLISRQRVAGYAWTRRFYSLRAPEEEG